MGVYTDDSSICRAAIHSGVLQNFGGDVEVIKAPGREKYPASLNRDIESTSMEDWSGSFFLSEPNSIAR
jgi:hypothetical protein